MKANLKITIEGGCSEPKNDLAESLKKFLRDGGYGKVFITGSSDDMPYDGFVADESIEIVVR